jgi:hypothetical protein
MELKILKLFFILLFSTGSLLTHADRLNYQLSGEYSLTPSGPRTKFILDWVEKNQIITGSYIDDNRNFKTLVSGRYGDFERRFNISVPNEKFKFLTVIISNVKGAQTVTIPVRYVFNDDNNISVIVNGRAIFHGEP